MNPASIMKLMNMKNGFEARHPRIVSFVNHELLAEIPEDTVLELSITRPGQKTVTTNMKVTAEDLQLLEELKQLKK